MTTKSKKQQITRENPFLLTPLVFQVLRGPHQQPLRPQGGSELLGRRGGTGGLVAGLRSQTGLS